MVEERTKQQQRGNEIHRHRQVKGLALVEVVMGQRFFSKKQGHLLRVSWGKSKGDLNEEYLKISLFLPKQKYLYIKLGVGIIWLD